MSDWKPQLGRIALFPSVPLGQVTSAFQLYQEFWQREPDSFQKGTVEGPFAPSVAQGNRDELSFTCSLSPIRIDFTISPRQTALPTSEASFALIENSVKLRQELDHIIQVINQTPSVVPAVRVALAVQFTQTCTSVRDANSVMTSALPEALRVRLSEERDFILQVNRVRESTSINDLRLNLITKWAVEQVQVLTVAVVPGGPAAMTSPTMEVFNATILCDNNNVPANRVLAKQEQTALLTEAIQALGEQLRNSNLKVEGF
jgi:hypothetical protein